MYVTQKVCEYHTQKVVSYVARKSCKILCDIYTLVFTVHHPAACSEAFSLKSPLIKHLIMGLSHPLHSTACPVLLVITFPHTIET